MEASSFFDPVNEIHLLSFHLVFRQEINKSLQEFACQWNYHGLSTEGGLLPLQLWTEGVLIAANEGNSPLDDILTEEGLCWYGVDEEDPVVVPEHQAMVVPSISLPLSEDQLEHLQSQVPANSNRNERVTKYI